MKILKALESRNPIRRKSWSESIPAIYRVDDSHISWQGSKFPIHFIKELLGTDWYVAENYIGEHELLSELKASLGRIRLFLKIKEGTELERDKEIDDIIDWLLKGVRDRMLATRYGIEDDVEGK